MENKIDKNSKFKIVNSFIIFNILIFLFAFIVPRMIFIISITQVLILIYMIYIDEKLSKFIKKLEKLFSPIQNYEKEKIKFSKIEKLLIKLFGQMVVTVSKILDEDYKTTGYEVIEYEKSKKERGIKLGITAIILIFLGIVAYDELKKRVFALTFPSLATSLVLIYSNIFNYEFILFMHVISIYIFFRLIIYFGLKALGQDKRIEKFSLYLKILLDIIRFITLAVVVVNRDMLLGFKMPYSIFEGIVSTLALDSLLSGIKKARLDKNDDNNNKKDDNENHIIYKQL